MKNIQVKCWKLLVFLVLGLLMLSSCRVREKGLNTQILNNVVIDSLSQHYKKTKLVTSFYGDVLQGAYNPDSLGCDSAVFESTGIKLTFKKRGKGKVLIFAAKAKPVARSELTVVDSNTTAAKKNAESSFNQQNKETVESSQWTKRLTLLSIVAIILLVYWAYKKFT
ncbi:hypothetical protein [Pedobacter suwonensis]|uniref:hypothetical protein n=1 Tax=Pedobacter suwonensis TaxID=332999 RepID=UPI00119E10BC|nr:hypothetical protein [Pedobacter suwonensis]